MVLWPGGWVTRVLGTTSVLVGRAPECDVHVDEASVSPRHVVIHPVSDAVSVLARPAARALPGLVRGATRLGLIVPLDVEIEEARHARTVRLRLGAPDACGTDVEDALEVHGG